MASLSKSFICEFIETLNNEPALWQVRNEIHKNKIEKNKSWKKLLAKYKEVEKDATIEDVKKKVNSLRASYRRELQKIRKSKESGVGTDEIYIPSLWYFEHLNFLRDQEEPNEGLRTFDEPIEVERRSTAQKTKFDDTALIQKAVEHLEKSSKQQERDEADVYSESWAITFRKLNEEQKIYAKRIIDETLMHGQLDKLSYSSSLNLGIPQHTPYQYHSNVRNPVVQRNICSTPLSISQSSSPSQFVDPIAVKIPPEEDDNTPQSFQNLFNSREYQ